MYIFEKPVRKMLEKFTTGLFCSSKTYFDNSKHPPPKKSQNL